MLKLRISSQSAASARVSLEQVWREQLRSYHQCEASSGTSESLAADRQLRVTCNMGTGSDDGDERNAPSAQ